MNHILNLGAGVQSTTVFLMAVKGLIRKPDVAIFADTGWEPKAVYAHLERLEAMGKDHGIPIVRVSAGNLRDDITAGRKDFAAMPLYVLNNDSNSILRRQCTNEYKIQPIERHIRREILGLKPRQKAPREVVVRQWFGISSDEMRRVRMAKNLWCEHWYPLFADTFHETLGLDRPWSRQMCQDWLLEEYPQWDVPRSACIGCPYHTDAEWRRLKENEEEWRDAVEFDHSIRHQRRLDSEAYLHRSLKPLDEVDLRSDVQKGQRLLGFAEECMGMCGL